MKSVIDILKEYLDKDTVSSETKEKIVEVIETIEKKVQKELEFETNIIKEIEKRAEDKIKIESALKLISEGKTIQIGKGYFDTGYFKKNGKYYSFYVGDNGVPQDYTEISLEQLKGQIKVWVTNLNREFKTY